jgi:hypothetical protein
MVTRAEVEDAFRSLVKSVRCPSCELAFSDGAVAWGKTWREGREDRLREEGLEERDGPCKVKCALRGHRSWIDHFGRRVRSAETR